MSERPINTNDLRDYAQLILNAASELDATRTERNIARRVLDDAQARVKRLEGALEKIAHGEGIYGMQAGEYKAIARAALKETTDV